MEVDVVPAGERAAPVEDDGVDAGLSHPGPRRRRWSTASADRDVLPLAGGPVADLDDAVGQAAADRHDRRDADQLGVLELHAGADLAGAVVVEHGRRPRAESSSASRAAASKTSPSLPAATRWTSAGRDLARPAQPELVEGVLGDRRDRAGRADAVGAHGDRDELAVLVEHLEVERLGVLAAELEDVAHLDAAGGVQRAAVVPQRGQASPSRTSAASIVPSGVKSRPATRSMTWEPVDVGAGDPAGALDDARVDEVADPGRDSPRRARRGRCSP